MVKTTSASAATEAGLLHQAAPASSSWAAFSRVRLKTNSSWPACCICPAIDLPITPVPIQPIFMTDSSLRFQVRFALTYPHSRPWQDSIRACPIVPRSLPPT